MPHSDGTFSLTLAITTGVNRITIDGTDPAGNTNQANLIVKRGTGKLTVALSASSYQIRQSKLPEGIRLSAVVTDPDGRPLAGAAITFTLSIPGIQTVTQDATTSSTGKATFTTTIPKGADKGQGSATVLVSADSFGSSAGLHGHHDQVARPRRRRRFDSGPMSQLPSANGDVALSTLRHPPGGNGPLLGLSSFQHVVRDLSPLPRLGRGQDGLLRPGPPAPTAERRRDPCLLGVEPGAGRDDPRSHPSRQRRAERPFEARLRRGRPEPPGSPAPPSRKRQGDRGRGVTPDGPNETVPAPAAVAPRWSLWEDAEG